MERHKEQLRDQLRVMLIAAYFEQIREEGDDCEPEPVCCGKCGQITAYSAGLRDETNPLDKLCLSDECITDAIISFTAAKAHDRI